MHYDFAVAVRNDIRQLGIDAYNLLFCSVASHRSPQRHTIETVVGLVV